MQDSQAPLPQASLPRSHCHVERGENRAGNKGGRSEGDLDSCQNRKGALRFHPGIQSGGPRNVTDGPEQGRRWSAWVSPGSLSEGKLRSSRASRLRTSSSLQGEILSHCLAGPPQGGKCCWACKSWGEGVSERRSLRGRDCFIPGGGPHGLGKA